MTEEIMQAIKQAEAQAAAMKEVATQKAANLIEDSEKQAARLEQTAQDVCRAYRESQLKQAVADAENAYQNALAKKAEESKAYCARVLENADGAVSEIVGRIIGGSR